MNIEKKNKHLTLQDRIDIQECLTKGMTFKDIGKRIGKDPTTVSKEVKLHRKVHRNCFVKTDEACPLLAKAPFVCNGCIKKTRSNCPFMRQLYEAQTAQGEYEALLHDAREGIPLTKEEFYRTEKIVSDGIRTGSNVYHIIHANQLAVSKSTVYRHIQQGYYTTSKMDLPRAVKFKPRKEEHPEYVPKGVKIGRTYQDFLLHLENHPETSVVEMDTVIGRVGGKVIMTFQFVNTGFMFGLLLDNKTAAEASAKLISLKECLLRTGVSFGEVFPLLLTDNGGEFSNVSAFENDLSGAKETNLFFCDPNSPYQKPHVENNHTLFRAIVPKGYSFDDFSQSTVNTIFSHINSVKRKHFNGKSAYDMFSFTYSEQLSHALGIIAIEPSKVIQNTNLLRYLKHH